MFSAATKTNNVVAAAPSTDPYFYDVTLLLNGDGTNGAQNNTFLDSSTNAFTVTRNGTPTQGTFTPFGTLWSNYFNGSTDYLTYSQTNATGTNNFCLECWVYPMSTPSINAWIYGARSGSSSSFYLWIDSSLRVNFGADTGPANLTSSAISINTWTHIAVVRNGSGANNTTLYINGVSVAQQTNTYNYSYTGSTPIGNSNSNAYYFTGYISNLRLTIYNAVYTSNFTPSTNPLTATQSANVNGNPSGVITGTNTTLLTCQSSRFVDNSTNNFTITPGGSPSVQRFSPFNPTSAYSTSVISGSMYFNGSTDYLSAPLSTALQFGTGDLTVELWSYLIAKTQLYPALWTNSTSYSGGFLTLYAGHDSANHGQYQVAYTGSGFPNIQGGTIVYNAWTHLAVVRSGTTLTLYVNGTSVGSIVGANASLDGNGGYFIMGANGSGGGQGYINGYISNLRVVKGTAVYTSNFTPPTAPLTAITNTSLLVSGTNAGIPDYAMSNDLITVGAAQVSTTQKKFGTGSINYNGTTSYLTAPSSYTASFGTGNFTIEMWIYPTSLPANSSQSIFANWPTGTPYTVGQFNLFVGAWGSGVTYISFSYATTTSAATNLNSGTGSSVITVNAWNFVSLVRSGTSLTIYVNGTSVATTTLSTSTVIGVNSTVTSGSTLPTGSDYFAGYIDDLRVTKGYARPTTTPTAAWPLY